jgi:hypothetical protein
MALQNYKERKVYPYIQLMVDDSMLADIFTDTNGLFEKIDDYIEYPVVLGSLKIYRKTEDPNAFWINVYGTDFKAEPIVLNNEEHMLQVDLIEFIQKVLVIEPFANFRVLSQE